MTPSQVWDSICSYVCQLFPDCIVKKQYRPIEDIEKLNGEARPTVWVGLSNVSIGSVTTDATVVEDAYNFQLLLAWKLKDSNDNNELDDKLNAVQDFLTIFRYKQVDVGNTRFYFGLPTCTTPFDEDLLISPGIFLSTCTIPLSLYRDLNNKVVVTDNGSTNESGSAEDTASDTEG